MLQTEVLKILLLEWGLESQAVIIAVWEAVTAKVQPWPSYRQNLSTAWAVVETLSQK